MRKYDIIIVGGSAAGIPAAITARRHYPSKTIALIRKEKQVLIPCGIPYIFGTVDSTDNNLISDKVLEQNKIDLIIDEAKQIDCTSKLVIISRDEKISYDKLVLATGSTPLNLPIPGIDKQNVFVVEKDVSYLNKMLQRLNNAKNVVVLGGGFIGVEFADELRKRGLNVSIVEMLSHCLMLAFDESFCQEAEEILRRNGVDILADVRLDKILGDDKVNQIQLSDGRVVDADIVLIGIGVRPNIALAESAGIEIRNDGIVVDAHMQTSDENVFACGDCTIKKSFFTGKPTNLKLASIATMESRVAGANLFEIKRKQEGVIGVFSTIVDNTVFAVAGLGEKQACALDYNVVVGEVEAPNRHPGKMPGATNIKLKLVFNKSNGEILGGTARGSDSVGEMINTISACIQKKMTANDIAQFQLGTHPAVTASPIAYQLVNAAELAIRKMSQ
jgi:pyruvate/2-oxoglutarate dehydrogenase complex dihydrolipoamide dehydrogenase (E3) component